MRFNLVAFALVAAIIASVDASLEADHGLTRMSRVIRRQGGDGYGSDSYGASNNGPSPTPDCDDSYGGINYGNDVPPGSTENSGEAQYGGGGGGGMGGGGSMSSGTPQIPDHNPDGSCHYMMGADGVYTLTDATQVSGCDYQVAVPNTHSTPTYSCNAPGSPSLIGVNALNCANVCILSTACPPPQSCNTPSNGQLIDVNALNCANVALLAGPGGLLGALGV